MKSSGDQQQQPKPRQDAAQLIVRHGPRIAWLSALAGGLWILLFPLVTITTGGRARAPPPLWLLLLYDSALMTTTPLCLPGPAGWCRRAQDPGHVPGGERAAAHAHDVADRPATGTAGGGHTHAASSLAPTCSFGVSESMTWRCGGGWLGAWWTEGQQVREASRLYRQGQQAGRRAGQAGGQWRRRAKGGVTSS